MRMLRVCGIGIWIITMVALAQAQVPPNIEAGLRKIGQIVDPPCTAVLYRPLMPKKDYNTYWPVGASQPVDLTPLYPGVKITRDMSFGPHPKDLVDVFSPEKGGTNLTVLIYISGGGGNKLEQQNREANAFYDNIGRWAVKNGMIAVTMQRHPGQKWDDGGRDVSMLIQWLQASVAKFGGNPNRMFAWAQSAGNGPLGIYLGHPTLYGSKGVGLKGAIFMSGTPVPGIVPPDPNAPNPFAGSGDTCGVPGGAQSIAGAIAGPSGAAPAPPRGGAPAGQRGGRGAGRGGQQLDAATLAARNNLPGFKTSTVKIMLARAELDPGIHGGMAPSDIALHDELCKLDGPKAKDGVGHCPRMLFMKGESHISEVFSIDTADKTVSGPVLDFIKSVR